ncbi:MAG: DUF4230 domain-containing protein [Oscillospiraceae bacterium]|nr:DUF4230 domain-containing protein [Oscillospiraceae bacterium]
MRNEQKSELARIVLYSLCSLIVGCAVGGALLMKIAVQGKALPAKTPAAPAEMPVAEALPEQEEPTEPEPVAEPLPPDADTVRNLLQPTESLLKMTYCYTDSDSFETHNEMFGKKVPFTTESVILTYDGTICMGIDPDAIVYTVDPENRQIIAALPQPEILSHDLDEDSIQYYDVKSSIFRSTSFADYAAQIRSIKQEVCDRVVKDREFDRLTTENAQTVIRSWLSGHEVTKEYTVVFTVSEADSEPAAVQEEGTLPEPDPSENTVTTETTAAPVQTEAAPAEESVPFGEPPRSSGNGQQNDAPYTDWPFTFWW